MSNLVLRVGDTAVPLTARVSSNGVKQTGETVTVKIKNDTTNQWLDFNDNTFKSSGWTTKTQTLTEDSSESGFYGFYWNSSAAVTTEMELIADYEIASGDNTSQCSEHLYFTNAPQISNIPSAADNADAVWDEVRSGHTTIGTYGETVELNNNGVATNTITADSIASDSIGASELATDAIAEIADGVLDELLSGHTTVGSLGKAIADIETDTSQIQSKLPDNNIMGSSVTTDKDDEIDAIKAKTDNLPVDPTSETNATANKNEIITEIDANETKIDSLQTDITSILGLVQQNFRLFPLTYDSRDQLLTATIKIYPTATDTDNDTNEIAEFSVTSTYSGPQLTSYKVTKV